MKLLRHILGIRSSLLPEGIAAALAQMACDQIMVPSRRPRALVRCSAERWSESDREAAKATMLGAVREQEGGEEREGGEVFMPLNWTRVRIS